MVSGVEPSEIVFFDLETTIPLRPGQEYAILEFGSITVCPKKLTQLDCYETLVKPHDLSLISPASIRSNGITADDVVSSPTFSEIADRVYGILHGRVWAGHNILRFDCVRLREAYAQINRVPPEAKGTIDSLALLTQRFGRRAGDMKMTSLAAYFGLGQQKHRSLDDVRMNIEVLKNCATVLFLESSQSNIFTENDWASPNATNNYHFNGRTKGTCSNNRNFANPIESCGARPGPFQIGPIVDKMDTESLQTNEAMIEESSSTTQSNAFSNQSEFIDPDGVSMSSITVSVAPFFHGSPRIQILHRDSPMQLQCNAMRIRFGLSTKFVDHAGRPRLSFVVDVNSSNLCSVLDAYDNIAKRFVDSDSDTQWRSVVSRNPGYYESPIIRLHIPTVAEDSTRWITEIYHKESALSSSASQLVSGKYDVAKLDSLFRPGSLVDAYFSLDPYNYQQNAGIRLVAKKLVVYNC